MSTALPNHAGLCQLSSDFGVVIDVREMVVLYIHIERRVPDGGDRGKRRSAVDTGDGNSSHNITNMPRGTFCVVVICA